VTTIINVYSKFLRNCGDNVLYTHKKKAVGKTRFVKNESGKTKATADTHQRIIN